MPVPVPTRGRSLLRPPALLFLFVWLLSAAYLGFNLNRGWVPHDEGILAQSAERVLHGELPHRDFDEPYTGGLAYLDAAAFRLFGVNLMVLRWVLFGFFLLWVPAVFAIACEFSAPPPAVPWSAAAATLLSVAWSVPNYPAAMPSWYCLFFATFGTLAVLRYLRAPHSAWLFAAGVCGGLSALVKTPGLYFVAAVLLFLLYREQSLSENSNPASPARSQSVLSAYFLFLLFGLLSFAFLVAKLVMTVGGAPEFVQFVLPILAIISMLLVREFRSAHLAPLTRLKLLARLLAPFLAGLAVPVSLFGLWYLLNGALHALLYALAVLQVRRVSEARTSAAPLVFVALTLIWLVFLASGKLVAPKSTLSKLAALLVAASLLLVCAKNRLFHLFLFESFANAVPVLVLATVFSPLHVAPTAQDRQSARGASMLLLLVVALWSLVQFPFSTPLYFCYVAPLVILSLFAIYFLLPHASSFNWGQAASLAAFFALFLFPLSFVLGFKLPAPSAKNLALLEPSRAGGLRVEDGEASQYNLLIPFVVESARGGPILAGPDCPEVYFLAGIRNPSRSLFEFLEEPAVYQLQIAALLRDDRAIRVAVICQHPQFSITQRNILTNLVRGSFPNSRQVGDFIVYWRQ